MIAESLGEQSPDMRQSSIMSNLKPVSPKVPSLELKKAINIREITLTKIEKQEFPRKEKSIRFNMDNKDTDKNLDLPVDARG
jgi:hypothetical protein